MEMTKTDMEAEKTEKTGILRRKSLRFAVRIVNLSKYLKEEKKEYTLSTQILKSGTSIGANLAESATAFSKKDFISKVYISLKECSETLYWLELLYLTEYISEEMYRSMQQDCEELRKMLSATTKTAQEAEIT